MVLDSSWFPQGGGYGGGNRDDDYDPRDPYGLHDRYYWSDQGFNNTKGELTDTPLGQIQGMHHTGGNVYGGTHHTVYGDGQRISWDTDTNGNYVDGSVHRTSN